MCGSKVANGCIRSTSKAACWWAYNKSMLIEAADVTELRGKRPEVLGGDFDVLFLSLAPPCILSCRSCFAIYSVVCGTPYILIVI